jgi:succinoglycan biosynthesis transport protein ExoP
MGEEGRPVSEVPGRPVGYGGYGYGEDEGEPLTWEKVRRFLEAPLRRPLTVLVPWAAVVLLSVLALFVLPKKYRSSTLILVESEKVPDSFVPKVATEETARRLDSIKPEILSRTRLERVLADTHPYPSVDSPSAAIEKMRRAIDVQMSGADGFTIEYVHSDPHKAQQVTDRLATLFIEETAKSREEQVEDAVDFLVTQVADARKELEKKDEALRRFKEARMGMLPEQLQTNLATLQMLQRDLQSVEENLIFARERQESLARGISRGVAAPTRGGSVDPSEVDLAELRRQLAALRGRYTDEHPDVQSLRARIERLEAKMAVATGDASATVDEDPAAVTRQQISRSRDEVKKLEEKRTDLEGRIKVLRARVDETPRTEQELSTLMRDYEKLNENYTALLSKQLEAQMAGRLERRWKGDRFRVLDPAHLPEKPFFPSTLKVVGAGVVLGLFLGLGICLGVEVLDPTVKNVDELSALASYPVLARIPHVHGLARSSSR